MPFTNHRGLVAGGLQDRGKRGLKTVKPIAVAQEAVEVAMFSSQYASARWTADGIRTERICENRSFLGYSVNVRSVIYCRAVGSNRLQCMVVRKNEYDVWSIGGK